MGESRNHRRVGWGLLALGLMALCACSSGSGSSSTPSGPETTADYAPLGADGEELPAWERAAQRGAYQSPAAAQASAERRREARARERAEQEPVRLQPTRITASGPQLRVTWEALAVEQDRFENPRFGRKRQAGVIAHQKIVLVSASHVEAQRNRCGRPTRENRGIAVAELPDEDMKLFVQGLQSRGFFQLARPTGGVERLFQDENARGRITVEQGGQSHTLLSMRGQGMDPATKNVPRMYSEAKQAILLLRNQTSAMSVINVGRDPLHR